MAMDKITTHNFKRNSYVNKFPLKLSNAYINQLLCIVWGWVSYEYIRKIMKLHTVDLAVNYYIAVGKEDLFLCETETNVHSMSTA